MAINVLQPEIYNRISAGEVVEKPASVVKELVENAIDAKATNISISIIGGGIEQIKVLDNGCGIAGEDIKKAFLPHSTSKISNLDDLDKIITLGFRGEALASIASVSQIQMVSKTLEEENGNCIYINGGVIDRVESKGCPNGTQIIVNNLFYNTPARYKFLKKPKQEENEITNLISRFILAHPEISFTYTADNKVVYQSSKSDLKQAIYVVYGKDCYDSLQPINFKSDKFKISGFIAKPSYVKPNRTYQILMVNGRYVINQTVSTAVNNAFSGYLMTGKFPFFVINIDIPYEDVDVNVHPTKMEVKFQDANAVFKAVYVAVKNALDDIETVITLNHEEKSEKFVNEPINIPKLKQEEGVSFQTKLDNIDIDYTKSNKQPSGYIIEPIVNADLNDSKVLKVASGSQIFNKILEKEYREKNSENINVVKEQIQIDNIEDLSYKIAGKLFNTYLIIEKEENVYIIDQHAAHERLLFDKLYQQSKNNKVIVQELLIPQMINVNHIEYSFLQDKLENLKSLGFDIQQFGSNTFKVNAVPQLLCEINIQEFFNDLLNDLNSFRSLSNEEIIRDKLASKACKSAVKGGDDLSESEIKTLINNMLKQTTPYLCPHGRPIIIKTSKTEIEKMFKRIV